MTDSRLLAPTLVEAVDAWNARNAFVPDVHFVEREGDGLELDVDIQQGK